MYKLYFILGIVAGYVIFSDVPSSYREARINRSIERGYVRASGNNLKWNDSQIKYILTGEK